MKFSPTVRIIYNIKKPRGRVRFALEKDGNLIINFISPQNIIFSTHFSPTDRPKFFQILPVILLINLVSPKHFLYDYFIISNQLLVHDIDECMTSVVHGRYCRSFNCFGAPTLSPLEPIVLPEPAVETFVVACARKLISDGFSPLYRQISSFVHILVRMILFCSNANGRFSYFFLSHGRVETHPKSYFHSSSIDVNLGWN